MKSDPLNALHPVTQLITLVDDEGKVLKKKQLLKFDILKYIDDIDLPRRGDSDPPISLITNLYTLLLIENPSKIWLNKFMARRKISSVESMSEEQKQEAFELICVGASPGVGKTTFLNSLSRIDRNFFENEEIAEMYSKTWFISISLGWWSMYAIEFNDVETSLSIRLLYSHFFRMEENLKDSFFSFLNDIPTDYRLSMKKAIKIIQLDLQCRMSDKKYIVILVDELNKERLQESPVPYIRSLCSMMNNEIDVCFTSLETVSMDASVTYSSRLINWITLETPTPDAVRQLFEEANIEITEIVNTAILYVCSNWRCVSILVTLLHRNEEWIYSPSMFQLESELLKKLKKFYRTRIMTEHVVHSVLAKPMDTSEEFTYKCIRSGVYMSPITDNLVVPKMNYILLVDWAQQNRSNDMAIAISSMIKRQEKSRFSPEKLEVFHGYWECARRRAFVENNQNTLKISELYNDKGIYNRDFDNLTVVIESNYITKAHVASIDDVELNFNVIYVIGGNNPGFDSCVFHKTLSGETIVLCIQNKYSYVDTSEPVYSDSELKEGIENTVLLFDDRIGKFKIKHLYFVVVACRRYSENEMDVQSLLRRCVLE
eukprot:TRINITY_DN3226_c0_g2_i1.p1 TRINITY_DN3226_c0_g2~~TRINITY_DN3226_c0_g2_i1.p1  ORF type:complete len:601 (-),score=105.20 TRINITY_DN3226_c0_g2_i1:188-1990(-)